MKKIYTWLICATAIFAAGNVKTEELIPPVGDQWLKGLDYLWQDTGQVRTAMSSSTHPINGNRDMSNFHGKYRGEKILAKIDGPGCVYRLWSAMPSGRLKVYLDGSTRPEISCGFKNYLTGKCDGLTDDFVLGRWANYMPIPFEKSIIITAPGFTFPGYYQVSYQTYGPAVKVESFKKERAAKHPALESAAAVWGGRALEKGCGDLAEKSVSGEAAPAGMVGLALEGAGVIRRLAVKNPENPSDPLAGIKIEMFWDQEQEPSVSAPVDAFFINRFNLKNDWPGGSLASLFITASDEGYVSFIPMPFANGAYLKAEIAGAPVELTVCFEKRDGLPENSLRFRAEYREQDYETDWSPDKVITTNTAIDPATNYVVLDRAGQGHYLGCALFVESVGTLWWGEGDENTYIDGAAEPQIQGTGTEDEFNWSWGYNPHMSAVSGTLPVIPPCDETIVAQVVPQLRNKECQKIRGENIAYRFRPSDYVPFEKSIKVSYEILGNSFLAPHLLGNMSQQRGDDYASVAYWYEMQ